MQQLSPRQKQDNGLLSSLGKPFLRLFEIDDVPNRIEILHAYQLQPRKQKRKKHTSALTLWYCTKANVQYEIKLSRSIIPVSKKPIINRSRQ